jgi:xanthine dehydrogenase accessory factor
MTGDDLTAANMVCGGKAEVFVEFLPASERNIRVFEHIKNSKRKPPGCYLITQIGNARGEYRFNALITDDSDVNRELDLLTIPDGLMDAGRSLEESALLNYEGKRLWVDVIKCKGVVYIMGAGHVSREVNDLAIRVGFSTVVMDDREEYVNRARFKVADDVIVLRSFEQCFKGMSPDSDSYVVIVTRGHMHDKQVLGQVLLTDAGYIGMIGSTRKRDVIYRALIKEGFTAEQLARVHCPIGINIESKTPAEIAVSIIAELINVMAQKSYGNK